MAPELNLPESSRTDLSICITNEDDTQTASNPSTDSTDKTQNTNSQCSSMSDGESYECYGEVEMDSSPPTSHQIGDGNNDLDLKRNTWLRTSVRRSAPKHNENNISNRKWSSFRQSSGKKLGSNALASHLYRSSSFNSSGRSSVCDTTDEVYSDVSLEEDVLDLNHKVQMLQQQMNVLADNQTHSDERYTRAKQENAALQARILMLEEQLREVELRSEEKLAEEEKRHRELVARVDREKQLQVENCAIKLQTLELSNENLKEEASRLKYECDLQRKEKERLKDKVEEFELIIESLEGDMKNLREQERRYKEQQTVTEHMLDDYTRELQILKMERTCALVELQDCRDTPSLIETELQKQLNALRQENINLRESQEELQAVLLTRSVQEGRTLLSTGSNTLAAELEQMTDTDQESTLTHNDTKMKTALKEQQEVNAQLRRYIDTMLLNIVENYPQLLEVKNSNI